MPTIAVPSGMRDSLKADYEANLAHEGVTEKMAYAVAWVDAKVGTDAEGAASYADVFGKAIDPGTFSNHKTRGLRALGRDADIGVKGTGTSGGSVKVRSFADMVAAFRADAVLKGRALSTARNNARNACEVTDVEIIDGRVAELEAEIERLKAECDALMVDGTDYAANVRTRLEANRDAVESAFDNGLDAINVEMVAAGMPTLGHDDFEVTDNE